MPDLGSLINSNFKKSSVVTMPDLIGKEIRLYPGDRFNVYCVVRNVFEHGMLLEISYTPKGWSKSKVGQMQYISFSHGLSFLVESSEKLRRLESSQP